MPLLRSGIVMPVKGIDFSKPATFIDDQAGFPQNMRYYKSEMRKRPGKSVIGARISDSTQIMGLGKLETSSLKIVIRASKTKLQKYNTSALAWQSIANVAFTGGDEDFFSFANVPESEIVVITNFIDSVRKWTGSGTNAVLAGSPPKAKYACYLSPYLLLGYTNDGVNVKPWGIDWCDTDDPENWSTGNSGSALLSSEPSPIQNVVKLNEYVAVYKKESLWLGRKVETSDIFMFECIKTGIGLAAPRAIAEAEGQHYFMGANDFYVWNGVRETPIGGPVREIVFETLNRTKVNRCFAEHVKELSEIWFFIIVTGNDWPTEIWKYNYRYGFWYYDTCSSLTAAIRWERTVAETWDDDSGTWDEATDAWDSGVTVSDWEEVMFGDSSGYCHKLDYTTTNDGTATVSSYLATKDFVGQTIEKSTRWLQVDIWARGPGKLYVDYSDDKGETWTNIPYSSSQAYIDLTSLYVKYEMFFDVWSETIRFRFRSSESNETFYIRSFMPYYLSKEDVRKGH